MADTPELIAAQATALCGTNFQLHGRDREHGLDCIGLAEASLAAAGLGCDIPNGYSMRGGSIDQVCRIMECAGFAEFSTGSSVGETTLREGDVVLARPSPVQLHFMIRTNGGFVHAHAGLGKVVFSAGEATWPIIKIFRFLEK